jgi:hypothetical protein
VTVDGGPWGWCVECGDGTEVGDDPRPDLCAMCATAGRGGYEPVDPDRQWPPPQERKDVQCSCAPHPHRPGGESWCALRIDPPESFVRGAAPWA